MVKLQTDETGAVFMSIEETNKLRASLGLKPLDNVTKKNEDEKPKEEQPQQQVDEATLDKIHAKKRRRQLLMTQSLGDDVDEEMQEWVSQFTKRVQRLNAEKSSQKKRKKRSILSFDNVVLNHGGDVLSKKDMHEGMEFSLADVSVTDETNDDDVVLENDQLARKEEQNFHRTIREKQSHGGSQKYEDGYTNERTKNITRLADVDSQESTTTHHDAPSSNEPTTKIRQSDYVDSIKIKKRHRKKKKKLLATIEKLTAEAAKTAASEAKETTKRRDMFEDAMSDSSDHESLRQRTYSKPSTTIPTLQLQSESSSSPKPPQHGVVLNDTRSFLDSVDDAHEHEKELVIKKRKRPAPSSITLTSTIDQKKETQLQEEIQKPIVPNRLMDRGVFGAILYASLQGFYQDVDNQDDDDDEFGDDRFKFSLSYSNADASTKKALYNLQSYTFHGQPKSLNQLEKIRQRQRLHKKTPSSLSDTPLNALAKLKAAQKKSGSASLRVQGKDSISLISSSPRPRPSSSNLSQQSPSKKSKLN